MTPEQRARRVVLDWSFHDYDETRAVASIAAAIRAAEVELLRSYAIGFRNAAFITRKDGGAEVRAVAFEDAAAICTLNVDRKEGIAPDSSS